MILDKNMSMVKTNVIIHNIEIYWLITVFLFNTVIDKNYFLLGLVDIVNFFFIFERKRIKRNKLNAFFYYLMLSIIYIIMYQNKTIFRYMAYIFALLSSSILFEYLLENETEIQIRQVMTIDAMIIVGWIHSMISFMELFKNSNPYLEMMGIDYAATTSGGGYRICGITSHPIVAASISIVFLFLGLKKYKETSKPYYLTVVLVQIVTIIITKTRSAYLTISLVVGLFVIESFIKKKSILKVKKIVFFMIMLMLFFLLAVFSSKTRKVIDIYFVQRFKELFNGGYGSYVQRVGSISFILKYIREHFFDIKMWIGHGYGNLTYYLKSKEIFFTLRGFYVVDNQYVSMLFNIGIINTIVIMYHVLIKSLKKTERLCIEKHLCFSILMMVFFYEFIDKYANLIAFGLVIALLKTTTRETGIWGKK